MSQQPGYILTVTDLDGETSTFIFHTEGDMESAKGYLSLDDYVIDVEGPIAYSSLDQFKREMGVGEADA